MKIDLLVENINRIHTTEMGVDRIKKNLSLLNENVVDYCKNIIINKKCKIIRKGKNWYVEYENIRITVNANSYTIITAHKSKNTNVIECNDIFFKIADKNNIEEIVDMYKAAVDKMYLDGIDQWDELYPNKNILIEDIHKKELIVGMMDGKIVVAYVVNTESDEEYVNGKWSYPNSKYCILHRLCVNPIYQNIGIAKKTMMYLEENYKSKGFETIRLDSFTKNPYAEQLYDKLGYCVVGQAVWRKGVFNLREKKL